MLIKDRRVLSIEIKHERGRVTDQGRLIKEPEHTSGANQYIPTSRYHWTRKQPYPYKL